MRDSILISIHPEYVKKIISREKRFEFRRKVPTVEVRFLVIYATYPIMRVVALAEVKTVLSDTPERLWRSTRHSAGISKSYFQQYFDGREVAHAIELGRVIELKKPKALDKICSSIVAPQSYRFVDEFFLKKLGRS
jgi:predicted transcriptional regulator